MADLAASAVTVLASWSEGGVAGKRRIAKRVSVVLSGQGGTTNKIPAAAFGFRVIEEVSNVLTGTVPTVGKLVVPAATDGDNVYIASGLTSGEADYAAMLPADWGLAEPFVFTVKGY